MALVLVATAGLASANSFATIAEADAYLAGRLNAGAWTGASATERAQALIEATRELDTLPWRGARADSTQALSWPREWAIDPDSPLSDPTQDYPYYATTVIPTRVKRATYELALEFLRAGTTDIAALPTTIGIRRKKVDVLETEYEPGSARPRGLARFPRVVQVIAPLLAGSGSVVRC